MLDPKAVMKETIEHLRTKFTIDQLMENCYADGIPLTNHQAREIVRISDHTIDAGGFYIMNQLVDNTGTSFMFYNAKGELVQSIILRLPNIAKDRKIPSLKWLTNLFSHIDYHDERIEIKLTHKLIESHIRDGGTWTSAINGNTVIFIFKMNGKVKSHLEFHKEDLSQ